MYACGGGVWYVCPCVRVYVCMFMYVRRCVFYKNIQQVFISFNVKMKNTNSEVYETPSEFSSLDATLKKSSSDSSFNKEDKIAKLSFQASIIESILITSMNHVQWDIGVAFHMLS